MNIPQKCILAVVLTLAILFTAYNFSTQKAENVCLENVYTQNPMLTLSRQDILAKYCPKENAFDFKYTIYLWAAALLIDSVAQVFIFKAL